MISQKDFDFMIGNWTVLNKRLVDRLSNSEEWTSFEADYRCWSLMNGLASVDEMKLESKEATFFGLSYRMYKPDAEEWVIYWADSEHLEEGLKVQVHGKFASGIGEFFGGEMYNGKWVKLKFVWKPISENEAYWEQAYYDEVDEKWEVNWVMEFRRKNRNLA